MSKHRFSTEDVIALVRSQLKDAREGVTRNANCEYLRQLYTGKIAAYEDALFFLDDPEIVALYDARISVGEEIAKQAILDAALDASEVEPSMPGAGDGSRYEQDLIDAGRVTP